MTSELGHSITIFARNVDDTAEKLLGDENGTLMSALEGWLEDVSSALGATFDESSKTSAIAKLEAVLERARAEQVKAVRGLLDPENDESPLAGWRREIVGTVERGEALEGAINDLRYQLAIDAAKGGARARHAEGPRLRARRPRPWPSRAPPSRTPSSTPATSSAARERRSATIVVTVDPRRPRAGRPATWSR